MSAIPADLKCYGFMNRPRDKTFEIFLSKKGQSFIKGLSAIFPRISVDVIFYRRISMIEFSESIW
jgi:hypothetical protein